MSLIVLAACAAAVLVAPEPPKGDPAAWRDYKPSLPAEAVRRTNNRWPLSDQANAGGWARYAPMWDEFSGNKLNPAKWRPINPGWKGRQPAFFSPGNVKVERGMLQLTMRKEEPDEALRKEGYHTYSSAAVKSVAPVLYGYFEVRARPMRSAGSSSFWFYRTEPDRWTEIDVFEIGGKSPGFERKLHMTLHVMYTPTVKEHWSIGGIWNAPFDLADDFHVYGLEWDEQHIRFYFDGVLVREGPNTHWHQALDMNFDSETMPDWFGLPRDQDLPSTYYIDYVRAWQKRKP